jgi:hypothetical protein
VWERVKQAKRCRFCVDFVGVDFVFSKNPQKNKETVRYVSGRCRE